jgi:pimeloyl-ACP methyl ester carboxylesterase
MNISHILLPAGVAGVAGLALLGLNAAIRRSLRAPRIRSTSNPADHGLAYSSQAIPTSNSKKLNAWWLPATTQTAPTLIVVHGWGGNAAMMLPVAQPLHAAGFALLFIESRCHGNSDGDSFSSMPRFAEDIDAAFTWLKHQPGVDGSRIGVLGHSVGASAALLAASRAPGIAAVASIAAFEHPESIMRRFLATKRVPFIPFGWYVLRYVQQVIGYRFDTIASINTIRTVRCPVLLVHGLDDSTVPASDAQHIHANAAPGISRLLLIPGDHDSYGELPARMSDLINFLQTAMPAAVSPEPTF